VESFEEIRGWFAGRLPSTWFEEGSLPEVAIDREEILVVGTLADVNVGKDAGEEALEAARAGRVKQFREDTREERMRIAREAQYRFRRKVSWGAECGGRRELFTTASVPVMTRLRMPQREVLDALVESGVARSRSHALAWCVALVRKHQAEWLSELKEAMTHVEKVRAAGPDVV
jgi:hypothetical protein